MERVLVQLTGDQIAYVRRRAAASDRSVAAVVREAVDALAAGDRRRALIERALASLDGFPSAYHDLAENHDRYLDDEIDA